MKSSDGILSHVVTQISRPVRFGLRSSLQNANVINHRVIYHCIPERRPIASHIPSVLIVSFAHI